MGHIDILGADVRTGFGSVAAVDALITEQRFQALSVGRFTGIHQPHGARQYRVGSQEPSVGADTGGGTAKAIDTARGLDVFFQLCGCDTILTPFLRVFSRPPFST